MGHFSTKTYRLQVKVSIDFSVSSVNTTNIFSNSLRYFACKVWNMVPLKLKSPSDVDIFKSETRK